MMRAIQLLWLRLRIRLLAFRVAALDNQFAELQAMADEATQRAEALDERVADLRAELWHIERNTP